MDVFSQVAECVANVLNEHDAKDITGSFSIKHEEPQFKVEIRKVIEMKFNREIANAEERNWNTVQDVVNYINARFESNHTLATA